MYSLMFVSLNARLLTYNCLKISELLTRVTDFSFVVSIGTWFSLDVVSFVGNPWIRNYLGTCYPVVAIVEGGCWGFRETRRFSPIALLATAGKFAAPALDRLAWIPRITYTRATRQDF